MSDRIIVLIEDSDTDALLVQRRLKECIEQPFELLRHTAMTEAEEYIEENRSDIDLIISDLGLPDTSGGSDTFERLKKFCADIPVVILTSLEDHNLAIDLVSEGADTFVNKSQLTSAPKLLRDAVDFAMTRHRLNEEKDKQAQDKLAEKDMVISWMTGSYSVS